MRYTKIHDKLQYKTIANRVAVNYDLIEVDTKHKQVKVYNPIKQVFELYSNYNTKRQLLEVIDRNIKEFFGNSVWWLQIDL